MLLYAIHISYFTLYYCFKLLTTNEMSYQPRNIDEFGRDLSLKVMLQNQQAAKNFIAELSLTLEEEENQRQAQAQAAFDFMAELHKKYAGMSWAEITWAAEEEEEEEERKKIQEKNKKSDEHHRYLYTIGEYELEEGEVFE